MRTTLAVAVLAGLALAVVVAAPGSAQASPNGAVAIAAGAGQTCVILEDGQVRCWGSNGSGQLGYGNTETIGDDEAPALAGPVDLGSGRTATAITTGDAHTCALLDDRTVRCWGLGSWGQLGYGNMENVGDDETPADAGPVDLGPGRTATAIAAGSFHTCAILDTGDVRCWGNAHRGQLGYGDTERIGDDETPAEAGAVDLGPGRTATGIAAGSDHTCAILDTGDVRCWGFGDGGQLGYGNRTTIGDTEAPGSVGPVNLGAGQTASTIAAGGDNSCALLDDGNVRCWGLNYTGQLGYGNTVQIGDDETPADAGPIDFGAERTVTALDLGFSSACAVLDTGAVHCWGDGQSGELGYGNHLDVGDNEAPGSLDPVRTGGSASAVAAAFFHSCAVLEGGQVRCWGSASGGRLGYAKQESIGDDEHPDTAGPVALEPPVPTRLGLVLRPKRNRDGPERIRTKGRLTGPFVGDGELCDGSIVVRLTRRSRTFDRARVKLEPAGSRDCAYEAQLRTRKDGRLKVRAHFGGNPLLAETEANEPFPRSPR